MHRRRFLGMTAGAASALTLQPWARAKEDSKPPTAYPDAAVEIVDPRFAKYVVINAAVERLYTGTRWAEGPVWVADGHYLLFSDIPNNRMLRWLEDTGGKRIPQPVELQQRQLSRPAGTPADV